MVLLVAVDGDIVEAGRDEMSTEFVGGVGMHTIDNLLPLLVGIGEAVILVYDDDLKGGDKVEGSVGKRQCGGTCFHHLAATSSYRGRIHL